MKKKGGGAQFADYNYKWMSLVFIIGLVIGLYDHILAEGKESQEDTH